jgi:hypothetical protein
MHTQDTHTLQNPPTHANTHAAYNTQLYSTLSAFVNTWWWSITRAETCRLHQYKTSTNLVLLFDSPIPYPIHQLPYHSMPYVFCTDGVVIYTSEDEATSDILNSGDKVSKVIKTHWRHDGYYLSTCIYGYYLSTLHIWILLEYPASARMLI